MGIGRAMTKTPNIAQKHPRILPNPDMGETSPYPTYIEKQIQAKIIHIFISTFVTVVIVIMAHQ